MGCGATKGKKYASSEAALDAAGKPVAEAVGKADEVAATPDKVAAPLTINVEAADDATRLTPTGLTVLFEEAGLERLDEEIAWQTCQEQSITDLGVLLMKEAAFSASLGLKQLERRRLRKALGRSGDSVVLELLPPAVRGDATNDNLARLRTDVLELLRKAQLEQLRKLASLWCEATGAASLDEFRENAPHFVAFSSLSVDEKGRLFTALEIDSPQKLARPAPTHLIIPDSPRSPHAKSMLKRQLTNVTNASMNSQQCLVEMLQVLDKDGSGLAKKEDLRHMLASLGMELDDEEAVEMLAEADKAMDSDGRVDYAEFVHNLMASPKMKQNTRSWCSEAGSVASDRFPKFQSEGSVASRANSTDFESGPLKQTTY